MTRSDAVEHAAEQLALVDEVVAEGGDLEAAMAVTGIGGRRFFMRWLERHDRIDLRAHFERKRS